MRKVPPTRGLSRRTFVQNELGVRASYPTFGWQQGRAEIEFIHRCSNGEVIPVEVKSGARTRGRSLRSFLERYSPSRAVKLTGSPGGEKQGALQTWPLYDAQFLREVAKPFRRSDVLWEEGDASDCMAEVNSPLDSYALG